MSEVPRDPHKAVTDEANRLFEYVDGRLFRRITTSPRAQVGMVAGTVNGNGYVQVRFMGRLWLAHRVIFAMRHGWVPTEIDHIDGDRANNRIENLRPVTRSQNLQNARRRSDNTSGVRGVTWSEEFGKWHARIWKGGVSHCIGYFSDLADAKSAREYAELEMFGEYRRANEHSA